MEDKITITMEEYKELLIIKGKYEELKSNQLIKLTEEFDYDKSWRKWNYPTTEPLPESPYKITCKH